MSSVTEDAVRQLFEAYDHDKSESIELADIEAALKDAPQAERDVVWKDLVRADKNGDGKVTREELRKHLEPFLREPGKDTSSSDDKCSKVPANGPPPPPPPRQASNPSPAPPIPPPHRRHTSSTSDSAQLSNELHALYNQLNLQQVQLVSLSEEVTDLRKELHDVKLRNVALEGTIDKKFAEVATLWAELQKRAAQETSLQMQIRQLVMQLPEEKRENLPAFMRTPPPCHPTSDNL